MLKIRGLSRHFGGVSAVSGLDLDVEAGKITGLIGPNGAGKTTLFNMITGFIPPHAGEISFKGHRLLHRPPHAIARLGIARTFQEVRIFRTMTVMDNLLMARRKGKFENLWHALVNRSFWKRSTRELREDLERMLAMLNLGDKADEPATDLSYGQSKLIEILKASVSEPDLLLLDEPIAGVHPAMGETIKAYLKKIVKEDGKTLFLIEHNIPFVFEIADRVVVLDHGVKIAEGIPDVIRRNPEVIEAYLGGN